MVALIGLLISLSLKQPGAFYGADAYSSAATFMQYGVQSANQSWSLAGTVTDDRYSLNGDMLGMGVSGEIASNSFFTRDGTISIRHEGNDAPAGRYVGKVDGAPISLTVAGNGEGHTITGSLAGSKVALQTSGPVRGNFTLSGSIDGAPFSLSISDRSYDPISFRVTGQLGKNGAADLTVAQYDANIGTVEGQLSGERPLVTAVLAGIGYLIYSSYYKLD